MKSLVYFLILLFALIALAFPYQMITTGNSSDASTNAESSINLPPSSFSWSISYKNSTSSAKASLRSGAGRMIEFRTQNGMTLNGKGATKRSIPNLVLYRNGELTNAEERTAVFELTGLPTASDVMTLSFQILTQHNDPDKGLSGAPVLMTEKLYTIPPEEINETIVFTHTFGAKLDPEQGDLATPTDYLQIHIRITDSQHPADSPLVDQTEEYAFLLENQWVQNLSGLSEDEPGAAPDEVVIYYCDMFTFQKDVFDPATRLQRSEVRGFIEEDLGPRMAEAVVTQTNLWGFPWSQAWTSYRGGEDSKRLSVALTMPGEWFHGRAPGAANSAISILTANEDYAGYSTLSEGILGVFHHELFHNIQRNVNQKMGGDGNIDNGDSWSYFTEGMAVMASSVGQPSVELNADGSYLRQANTFLSGNKFEGDDLNTSYMDMNPYRGAFYWRFLYEECGGIIDGREDPARGMQIIREALINLYSLSGAQKQRNLVEILPEVLDQAISAVPACPFRNYQESLTGFARRIYAIRRQVETCARCSMYSEPPATVVNADGAGEIANGGLPASYGIDLIEIEFGAQSKERSTKIGVAVPPGKASTLNVQMVRANSESQNGFEILGVATINSKTATEGATIYMETGEVTDDLALIITRVDADEQYDPQGDYTVSLR